MSFFLDLMHAGGPFMYPILFGAAAGVGVSVAQLRWRERTAFPGAAAGALALTLGAGITGTVQGLILCFEAVGHASAETKHILLAAGGSVSLITTMVAAFLAAAITPMMAYAWSKASPAARERVRPARAVGAVTAISAAAGFAALGCGAMAMVRFLEAVAHGTAMMAPDALATPWLGAGVVAGLVCAFLGLMNLGMGTLGGLRGLVMDRKER